MKRKNIGYAYASSDVAKHMGYTQSGCWYVAIYDDSSPMDCENVLFASYDKQEVIKEAEQFPYAYGTYSMHLTIAQ